MNIFISPKLVVQYIHDKARTKLTYLRNIDICRQKLLRLPVDNDTWQVETKVHLTIVNHLNIAGLKQFHKKYNTLRSLARNVYTKHW